MKMHKTKIYILMALISTLLNGCQVYSSSFSCSDAKGLNCKSLGQVDEQISSGEIEKIEQSNCKGFFCKSKYASKKPDLKMDKVYKATLTSEDSKENNEPQKIGDILYVE